MKLSHNDLPTDIQNGAAYLFSAPVISEQHDNGYDYFVETRHERSFGRTAIVLSSGSHADEGYEGYASYTTLCFNKNGELQNIDTQHAFEPGGPVIQLPHDIVDRLQAWFAGTRNRGSRAERQSRAAEQAGRHIATALRFRESH